MSILGALGYGLINVFHPRMLWLMVWPMLVALAIWGTAALVLWTRLAVWLAGILRQWLEPALGFVRLDFGDAALVAANVILFLLFVPLVYLTALFILGAFGMQKMVDYVAERSFPTLERRRGGSTLGSVWNALVAFGGLVLFFLASIPLWFIPPLWPLIPLAILSWVNQRLLRYDAVAEHADAGEMARLFRERRGGLYLLGFLLALLAYVPFIGFLGPVVFALAFIRYLLGALQEQRAIGSPYESHPNKELGAGNAAP
jgi:CysZ protein